MAPLFLALSLAAGFNYEAYAPGTFADFEACTKRDHPDLRLGQWDGRDLSEIHPLEKLRVRAAYAGKTRPLPLAKQKTVDAWCRIHFPEMATGFRREILVREEGRERWLPIQEPLWTSFDQEVRTGSAVDLFVGWFGTSNEEFVYLVNEFEVVDVDRRAFQDPVAAVNALYARGSYRAYEFYSSRLKALLVRDERSWESGSGKLNFAFPVNANDTEAGWEKSLRIALVSADAVRADVRAVFDNFGAQELRYALVQDGGRWVIDDVRSIRGRTWVLSEILGAARSAVDE